MNLNKKKIHKFLWKISRKSNHLFRDLKLDKKSIFLNIEFVKGDVVLKNYENKDVKIINIVEFLKQNNIKSIDAMRLSAKGAEYEILELLIRSGYIEIIGKIIIEFNGDFKNSVERRELLLNELRKSHKNIWSYYFVCEKWEKI